MKKLLLLFIMLCSIALFYPAAGCAASKSHTVELAENSQLMTYAPVEAIAAHGIQNEAPAVNYSDVFTLPDKDASNTDKAYWLIAVIVLLLWEIVFRLIPTTRSISVLTFLYNTFNLILKDRAENGRAFKIKKE